MSTVDEATVTSPDQRTPIDARLDRIGAGVTAAPLLVVLVAVAVAVDWPLRRNGLRS
jgi:hypothetical protein